MPSRSRSVVVDTSVVSILFENRRYYSFYKEKIKEKTLIISFQTLEEMWFGAVNAGWGERRRKKLERHLSQYEVMWPNYEMVEISARLRSRRKSQGRELRTADAWIAATALTLGYPLATHNRDFEGIPDLVLIKASVS